ncbi:MAG: tRNA (N(6)-L-threonylcarbamoyladenosine(37)-C(2))-methylthiotransferase [Candidatus Sumerlaeota bacterium]|nr:tRNA (N(6)-L-threonylcarbamoyladenosine(37)-C(2))-methylthiotransferase [Candidatus Sumerlaeota bacterium]
MTHRYFIETHGCSLNFSDSEYMEGRLEEADFLRAETPESADIIILNTCTVKDRTYYNFLNRLSFYENLQRQKGEGKSPALLIAGCIPRAMPDDPHLANHAILGADAVGEVAEVAEAVLRGETPHRLEPLHPVPRLNLPIRRRNPVIEILPIARGCLGACAYCQTRAARGELKSYPAGDIVHHARKALEEGVREIWLTAQDTGAWGLDLESSLPDLLSAVLAIPGEFRIRLGMANPNHVAQFTAPLLELFADRRLFRFLHLPLQSGSNRVLRAMNRNYTVDEFLRICESFYAHDPDFSIATDVIAGLPGETEDDFQQTLNVLEKIRPAVINRSRYSPRPGTPAALMPQHPQAVISERSRRLTELVERISLEKNRRWIGERCRVLIDVCKRDGSVITRNDYYKSIVINLAGRAPEETARLKPGDFCEVEVRQATIYHLIAEPVE